MNRTYPFLLVHPDGEVRRFGAAVLERVAEDLGHLRELVDVHFQRGGHLLEGILRHRRPSPEPRGNAGGGDEEEKSGGDRLCSDGDHFGRPG